MFCARRCCARVEQLLFQRTFESHAHLCLCFWLPYLQLAAGLCCGLSCLAAGGTIGLIGDCAVRCVGIKAERGRRWWQAGAADGNDDAPGGSRDNYSADAANKLYVGMLIMLIFSEALAL